MNPPADKPANPLPAELFTRADESDDANFYGQPRLVAHIDQTTIDALTAYYTTFIPPAADILDLMSSWISHLPPELTLGDVCGLGMNEVELQKNPVLTEHCVHNLNEEPKLPYADTRFDRALLVVSIQYLTQPVAVLQDTRRTLRPGGKLCIAMSHRMFPTKAIRAFHVLNPQQRVALVQQYLEQAGYQDVQFVDASPAQGDPLWLVLGSA